MFTTVVILYYPANESPNIEDRYYHEYFVPWKTLGYAIPSFWNITRPIKFVGVNVRDIPTDVGPEGRDQRDTNKLKNINLQDTLLVVSADFSHHLPLQEALALENCSAHGLMQRVFANLPCMKVVDKDATFELLYSLIPPSWMLQWVGRTRSSGQKAVGYLSFLLREKPDPEEHLPDSVFITAFDGQMRQRECLGNWFSSSQPWTRNSENTLLNKVIREANTTSRLLPGATDLVTHYTVTYLYKDTLHPFIRGWHGIRSGEFYLPDVLLESTFNNGTWIKSQDRVWDQGRRCPCKGAFAIGETLEKLQEKSGVPVQSGEQTYTLYRAHVFHHDVESLSAWVCEGCGDIFYE